MVKTLRITTVIAALLAIAVFAFPVLYGVKTDENIQKFLNSPDVLEKFKAISGNKIQTKTDQVHPLVQQSQVFAKILNPPPSERPVVKPSPGPGIKVDLPPTVKPQFTLISTSYYEAHPELSLALINEPGKGNSWVRQSSTVNHLLIEQVKDGYVIVRNGEETFQLQKEDKKLSSAFPGGAIIASRGKTPPLPLKPGRITTPVVQTPPKAPPQLFPKTEPKTETDTEKEKRLEDLIEKMKALGSANNDSNNPGMSTEEKTAQMQKLLIELRSSNININQDEAKKLADLGEMLDSVKNQTSASSVEPPPEN
jgi:hypothetical protein